MATNGKKRISFLFKTAQTTRGVRQVTLTTNGLLLDARTMDELKDMGIDGINFSIDTLDSKICCNMWARYT